MLLPHRIEPSDPRLDDLLQQRLCWSVVAQGLLAPAVVETTEERGALRERLAGCALVVLRRRHERLHGPILGLVRRGDLAELIELADLDELPWVDGAPTPWLRWGIEAGLVLVRHELPGVQLVVPDELLLTYS